MDQVRLARHACLRVEAQPLERIGADVRNENVAARDQLLHDAACGRHLQVEAGETLRAIEVHELAGELARMRRPADDPHQVALGRFDLDDLRAIVGEPQRRSRPHDDRREINDPDSRQQRLAHARPFQSAVHV